MRLLWLYSILLFATQSFAIPINSTELWTRGEPRNTISETRHGSEAQSVSEKNRDSWRDEYEQAKRQTKNYQETIDNFSRNQLALQNELYRITSESVLIDTTLSLEQVEQNIIRTNSQILDVSQQLQQYQEELRSINDSVLQLPLLQSQNNKLLFDAQQRLILLEGKTKDKAQNSERIVLYQAEIDYYKAYAETLSFAQLSAPKRQALVQLTIDILKAQQNKLEQNLQILRNQADELQQWRQEKDEQLSQSFNQDNDYALILRQQLKNNQELSSKLVQQSKRRDQIVNEQHQIINDVQVVRRAFTMLKEQAQWLNMSTTLGEIQRAQIARLPKPPKPQKLDSEIAEERALQLSSQEALQHIELLNWRLTNYQNARQEWEKSKEAYKIGNDKKSNNLSIQQQMLLKHQRQIYKNSEKLLLALLNEKSSYRQDNQSLIDNDIQLKLLSEQLATNKELLISLQNSSEALLVELAQLKVLTTQLNDALDEVNDAAHRYLFWVADVEPINFNYPLKVFSDFSHIIALANLSDMASVLKVIITTPESIILIMIALLIIIFSLSSQKHYQAFLERAAIKVGRVTQDRFSLTVRTVLWGVAVALPFPILGAAMSYGLQQAWSYPIAIALSDGIDKSLPLMWAFMLSANLAKPQGLFIVHFGWNSQLVNRAMRYYQLAIWSIIPMIIAITTFDHYNEREFASGLGRTCFFILCISLMFMAFNLRRVGIPLHLSSNHSSNNLINKVLWRFFCFAPIAAILGAARGYYATAQALIARIDLSVIIWFSLLIIYYIIRRWMFIQRRRIEFDRAKQRRAERMAQRHRTDEENANINENSSENEEPIVDLDTISAKSLALVRSILTMVALVCILAIWSEIHSAFTFLENIHLWDVSSIVQGVEMNQSITLNSVLIAAIAFVLTAQLIRNLPALLELGVLQHLDLAPGTGYAIITLSKYLLMIIGSSVALSLIGVDWSKLQWLIAALGVGLGFGLQEIFANFISGLIILFEKPIRINDMVTIRDLTGTITKIKTRATTILDWDRKEIIVPNKAFITEQFVNWSLSDSITRIVTTIPAEIDADPALVTEILKEAAQKCSLVLDTPAPDAFLVEIQQGIQLFELRVFSGEIGNRTPLRHELNQLILLGYQRNKLVMPFPPIQLSDQSLSSYKKSSRKWFSKGQQ